MAANLNDALRSACAQVGIVYRDVPADGNFHRTDTDGDAHGKGDGTIKLFPDGEGGIVRNWKGEQQIFFADDGRTLSDAERRDRDQRRAEATRKAKKEETRRHAEAAKKASALWKAATPTRADHPYLARKGVSPVDTLREIDAGDAAAILGYSLKSRGEVLAGGLLVALVKIGDKFTTCELIDEAGRKSTIAGGAKAGGYWTAQALPKANGDAITLLIGEGVATALSAKEATIPRKSSSPCRSWKNPPGCANFCATPALAVGRGYVGVALESREIVGVIVNSQRTFDFCYGVQTRVVSSFAPTAAVSWLH